MKAPKILPWLARNAGLNDELTLTLWHRAASESACVCGCDECADYYAMAVSRFIALAAEKSAPESRGEAAVAFSGSS